MNKNFWKDKKVLITGHTGFKGTWLVLLLKELGSTIIGISNKNHANNIFYNSLNISRSIKSYYCDLKNINRIKDIIEIEKPEIIFHLAAQSIVSKSYISPIETYETNVLGTLKLLYNLEKFEFVKSIIIATSDKCYKNLNKKSGYIEEDPIGGSDLYSSSKAAKELLVESFKESFLKNNTNRKKGIATVRSGNVLGGGDWSEDRLIPDIYRSIIEKKPLIIRDPKGVRPWQFVLDPLFGYVTLAEKLYKNPKSFSGPWNFGPKKNNSKNVKWIIDQLLSFKYFSSLKKNLRYQKVFFKETRYLLLNAAKSNKYLNWEPIYDCKDIISHLAAWFENFIKKKNTTNFCLKTVKDYIELRRK